MQINRAMTSMDFRRMLAAAMLWLAIGCGRDAPAATPTGPSSSNPSAPAFNIQGDPASPQGATWTYVGTLGGVRVDLQGILLKPQGTGPFPAVVISHGAGGNAGAYGRRVGAEMVRWGLVCIATNYTHAGGVPIGAPGTALEPGASQANVARGKAAYEILRLLEYVDMSRVVAHGHSMGAFVTTALVAAHPSDLRAASHTAGGVRPPSIAAGASPSDSQGRSVRTPYQLHHGDADEVVPIDSDRRLASLLHAAGVPHELYEYSGAGHDAVSNDTVVLGRIRAWYALHGLF